MPLSVRTPPVHLTLTMSAACERDCRGPQQQPGLKDVVIMGWANADLDAEKDLLQQVGRGGAWIVGIGPDSALSTRVQVFLESAPPQPAAVLAIFGGEKYPLVALQNLDHATVEAVLKDLDGKIAPSIAAKPW